MNLAVDAPCRSLRSMIMTVICTALLVCKKLAISQGSSRGLHFP